MGDIVTRKCAHCKNEVLIDKRNVKDVLRFQNKYYHSECFRSMATKKASTNRGNPQMWKDALNNMHEFEAEIKSVLELCCARDLLNDWLLENYNITTAPNRFWQVISDLENGVYQGRRCKPVKTTTLCDCWKWGQAKLNEINQFNLSHNKGPKNDSQRLMYDLAILVGKVPQFLAYKEKQKVAENDMARTSILNDDVDMSKIGQSKQTKRRDISNISDDIFVE